MASVHDNNRALDLEQRVSYVHSNAGGSKEGGDNYVDVKTPGELEDGAIVDGGALNLFSREALGLFMQYGAIGVIYGMIPTLSYPIFTVYLNLEGYQTAAYGVLVTLGWSFKVVFGMLSDVFPIFGYRRKPWMLIGWIVTMICLSLMAFDSLGEPYCNRDKTKTCGLALEKVPKSELQHYNFDAPDQGTKFIILSIFVSFGYVTAACASDAMVVEYAQREPVAIRGRVQTAIYTVRTLTGILASLVSGFGLNGANYNGSFSFSMAPNVPYLLCLVPCVLVVISTFTLVVDKKTEGVPFKLWVGNFWDLLQQRVMWQICAFRVVVSGLQSIGATPGSPISAYWAKVEPLNDSLSSVLASGIFAAVLVAMGKWGLQWNWRYAIAAGTIGVMLVDGFVLMFTIWDVVRNQWFFTGVALADNVPGGIRFIVATYCAVEIADVGNEGATYGLVTTIANLMGPLGSVIYKYVDSFFKVTTNDIKADTTEVRWEVTYVYLISYSCRLLSLFGLLLLPPQKAEMQALKRKGGRSKLAGALVVFGFFSAISFAVTSNVMSIYPSTKCFRIAGGNGKIAPATGLCPVKK
ncbi:hypothetical protein DYB37_012020 [Aphanomyces astaci]|uniref:Major facilitator superfamily (MFS) profile domain-containing protein n=2 Tax=Aphanomyces astaci TaxID=112090 RepID=A0A418FKD7_APHAT|nr:hypothetical protein DYB37_012020 [Aphanomyces astaci]